MDAFYTDDFLAETMGLYFPDFEKEKIRILEPSVGTGNLLSEIFKKYQNKNVTIDVFDIDKSVLKNLKKSLKNIPENFKINYFCENFLEHNFRSNYDLVVANPPFSLARDFLEKCLTIGEKISIIMPKTFLSSTKFARTREFIENIEIENIIDFGERGFQDAKIETICLFLDTKSTPNERQKYITDKKFPYWLIYRDEIFDGLADKMEFDIFKEYRDRDLKNELLSKERTTEKNIWVLRSRNVTENDLKHIDGYDRYISKKDLEGTKAIKFLNREVFLAPILTEKIRVIKKPKNVVCNGSVAFLVPKDGVKISEKDLEYFKSEEFRKFYDIATNKSTRTKNIDKNSVYFFGRKNEK
jgi:DNA (cytosine-5)-methyltransferase 1